MFLFSAAASLYSWYYIQAASVSATTTPSITLAPTLLQLNTWGVPSSIDGVYGSRSSFAGCGYNTGGSRVLESRVGCSIPGTQLVIA